MLELLQWVQPLVQVLPQVQQAFEAETDLQED
jgi:hypothetical protein